MDNNSDSDEELLEDQVIDLIELANSGKSINEFMSKYDGMMTLKGLISFISRKKKEKNKSIEWGFYYVEKS